MQLEFFEHFADENHNCFFNECSIILIDKTDGSDPNRERKVLERGFENCSFLWVRYSKLMVTSALFYTFF